MENPIRIAMIMGKMLGGGVEAVVMNYYRNIDRKKIQFDFIIDNDSTIVPEKEINKLGGRVYKIAPYQFVNQYKKDLKQIFKSNNYFIVHSHINTLSVIPLYIAKSCRIPIRIAHNHSTAGKGEIKKNIIKYILRLFARKNPTHYMAPTKETGEWLFGKTISNTELMILKNAIDVETFEYNELIRNKMRNELGYLENDFVIGNIGRMVWSKNQKFVIRIFKEVKKIYPNSKLLFIGNGPMEDELIKLVSDLQLDSSVKFIKNTNKIADYYQAMDLFLFPSYYEGFGNVAIEAQANGLPVLASDKLPQELNITSLYHTLSLESNIDIWLEAVKKNKPIRENNDTDSNLIQEIKDSGYDIKEESDMLLKYYLKLIEELS